ncbi:hypothetical protein BDV93DRAFT_515964 [Ceratobasidium sp. AG-I]|nr:hypothetical protein BDV93DRAFT_515964 [Ceratobasidium sp. AG-I]
MGTECEEERRGEAVPGLAKGWSSWRLEGTTVVLVSQHGHQDEERQVEMQPWKETSDPNSGAHTHSRVNDARQGQVDVEPGLNHILAAPSKGGGSVGSFDDKYGTYHMLLQGGTNTVSDFKRFKDVAYERGTPQQPVDGPWRSAGVTGASDGADCRRFKRYESVGGGCRICYNVVGQTVVVMNRSFLGVASQHRVFMGIEYGHDAMERQEQDMWWRERNDQIT